MTRTTKTNDSFEFYTSIISKEKKIPSYHDIDIIIIFHRFDNRKKRTSWIRVKIIAIIILSQDIYWI